MIRSTIFLLALLFPAFMFAADTTISRQDGFLTIWESIQRAHSETRASFDDVPEDMRGYEEISFGKRRGILDDEEKFFPGEPLRKMEALLWIMRTRNIDDLDQMTRDRVPIFAERFRLTVGDVQARVTRAEIMEWMRLVDAALIQEVHEVSFYADDFHGRGTAFGETFDMHAITAAHRTLPHNTLVKVTNIDNGKSVVVRINDRGPYVHGRDMDLSLAAFEEIAPKGQGVLRATFERLGDEAFVDTCSARPRQYQKRIAKRVRFHRGVPHTWMVGEKMSLGANKPFVVRGITYPDGVFVRVQDFVLEDERYHFTPDMEGEYYLLIGTIEGRIREVKIETGWCN